MRYQQLGLFTREQMSVLRDRTRARNWSPGNDEERRELDRRRARGLALRHGLKLYRLRREASLARYPAEPQPPRPAATRPTAPRPAAPAPMSRPATRTRTQASRSASAAPPAVPAQACDAGPT